MLLRKLELYGFKSFADKTEVEFGPGITAIVGPNGSGKSNITDAIRWALGEQNIRNLRGAKVEDVIFAGSAKRRPLGVAEVSLVFDNSSGTLPLDFNEVTITRRVYRSGDSEYFINKAPCRLKDIHELLFDVGIGRDSLSVIGQNKIDEVLNAKAEERRLFFEEAAGITKYKHRKREALRKLEETEQNLVRVNDLIAEIHNQLGPLAESAERTKRYNALRQELISCQVTVLLDRLERAAKMAESARLEQETLTEQEVAAAAQLSVREAEKERLTDEINRYSEQQTILEQQISQAATELERIDGKMAVLRERIEQGHRSGERIAREIARLGDTAQGLDAKIALLKNSLAVKEAQLAAVKETLATSNTNYEKLVIDIQQAEQELEQGKEQTFVHIQQLVDERNKLRLMERDLAKLAARRDSLTTERQGYLDQLTKAEEQRQGLTAERDRLTQQISICKERIIVLKNEKENWERQLQAFIRMQQSMQAERDELRSRFKILTGMQQDYEGFSRGIKSLLKTDAPWRRHIHGAVAEVIGVARPYLTAIEVALGGALQHIITDDDETAKLAIAFLKTHNLGRATFLPLNTIRPSSPRPAEIAAAKAKGAIGLAASLVDCAPIYRPVIDFLLGHTVVAETLDAAVKIAKEQSFTVRLVTLDGQQVNPGGTLTGGSTTKKENSFLGRSHEIEKIKERLAEMDQRLAAQQAQAAAARTEVERLAAEIVAIQHEIQEKEVRLAEVAVHFETVCANAARLRLAVQTIEQEMETNEAEQQELTQNVKHLETGIALMESRDSQRKETMVRLQQELKKLQEQKEKLLADLAEHRVQLTALEQDIHTGRATCLQYEQDKGEIDKQLQNLRVEQTLMADQIARAGAEIDTLTVARLKRSAEKREWERQRQETAQTKVNLLAELQRVDKDIRELRRKHQELRNRLHDVSLIAAKYNYEIAHCQEQLQDSCSLSVEEAVALRRNEPPEVIEGIIHRLEMEIAAIGPVNPAAIEEYNRLNQRYNFYQSQSQDLIAAKEYLTSVINQIDDTMAKQFKAAFSAINHYFGEIFTRLFGGGKAELVLQQPDDILNTGIDVIAQPPGKKLQNLALLSGGERALTVIALLFAFLTYRPSPFCVVDEIDAALDEANVQRFSEFLRDYKGKTQFIVVTHRKGTMEFADIMQGVTMEESGVSRLVSVKFMDKAG
ncbi:chromosome segregation protein SMC [Sporolituus thermophilus]|uniref:Chromosome partition protein Smc n=1 Tax=Sporolituus thermophilus DSM 23256 TaxID=1123285 RepID=A0A1G7NVB5_9FIRM|nr:chromosome segregation protein SMC [Sporolituus thermophilus]SDF77269.1 condensin subunit Smc [Sporolituus thermophilus DSM 23256]